MYYTGIGSRQTPNQVCDTMDRVASLFAIKRLVLRSGAAMGADAAFERGHLRINKNMQIFIPWKSFVPELQTYHHIAFNRDLQEKSMQIASEMHPAWSRCSSGARLLHARNVNQILGPQLDSPSKFVICWTGDGQASGGTATAIRLAETYQIPVINLNTQPFDQMLPYELFQYVDKTILTTVDPAV